MYRIVPKCLLISLLAVLLFAAAGCEKTKEAPTSVSSVDSTVTTQAPTEITEPAETTSIPTASPAPTIPPEIVFDMSGDQSSSYKERLYIDANMSSLSVIGGEGEPVHISGKIADWEYYCYSLPSEIYRVEYAMDGSSLSVILDSNQFASGRLVYSDGMTAVNIAQNVDSFHMSGDGSAVLYLVTPKYEHGIGGDLYYYDSVTGESQLITEGAGRLFTISPKGDSISYTTFYETDNPDALTCYTEVIGNDPAVLDTDSYCAAISDDAKTVYYLKKTAEGEILLVNQDGESKQLSRPINSMEYYDQEHKLFFNIDQTQIVFNAGSDTYFSMSGSDPFKISRNLIISFLGVPHYSEVRDYLHEEISDSARSFLSISVNGTKNLCYVPFLTEDLDLLSFDEKMIITQSSMPESTEDRLNLLNVSSTIFFEREGTDILYYLAYPEDYNEEIQLNYNLTPFLDLYAVEDTPGADPVLIAEKVCMVEAGDFGVIYRQYKGEFKYDYEPFGSSYMATVGVYFSKDGTSFKYVMERPYVFQFGG